MAFFLCAEAQTAPAFSRCPDAGNWPYYHPLLRYKGGFWVIKQHFYGKFPKPGFETMADNTGIVRIRFWVNCHGEAGDYSVECCDFDYKPATVNPEIIKHLLHLLAELKDWIPGQLEGKTVNNHKFFAFRIDHGKLVDLLPK